MKLQSYRGRRVFVTGHTGFKGSWLCKMLSDAGATVSGYSLDPPTNPNLYELAKIDGLVESNICDIRDFSTLKEKFDDFKPEIVFHLAAQPIVKDGYSEPRYTYETNVMGTVNILECIRESSSVKSFVNVTTDKVYLNREWAWGYRENEELNGYDPYSNSKSCSELTTETYYRSFLKGKIAVSTARAGNVIGGGDFAPYRIIPDCVRSVISGRPIEIRNPGSTRPYQHVLEPLSAYLQIADMQLEDNGICGSYNIGPDERENVTTEEIVKSFGKHWGKDFRWITKEESSPVHEANHLRLDCSKIKSKIGWHPKWSADAAVEQVCEWNRVWLSGGDVGEEMSREIQLYFGD